MTELDNIVLDEIKKLAMDPEYMHEIRRDKNEKSNEPNKIDIIKAEIAQLDEQISRFMDLYGIGKFTIDQVSGKIDPLNEQKQALEKELESINADSEVMTEEEVIGVLNTFDEVMERGDLDEIRLIISTLIYYIEIDEEDVYIHWKFA